MKKETEEKEKIKKAQDEVNQQLKQLDIPQMPSTKFFDLKRLSLCGTSNSSSSNTDADTSFLSKVAKKYDNKLEEAEKKAKNLNLLLVKEKLEAEKIKEERDKLQNITNFIQCGVNALNPPKYEDFFSGDELLKISRTSVYQVGIRKGSLSDAFATDLEHIESILNGMKSQIKLSIENEENERIADEIVSWLTEKTRPAAKTLETLEDIKKLIDDSEVAVVGFFKDSDSTEAKEFMKAAGRIDEFQFGLVTKAELFSKVSKNCLVLFNKFNDMRYDLNEDLNEKAITKFIITNSRPLVVDFNHETAQKVFGGEIRSHLLMFLSKEKGDYEKYLDTMRTVAKYFNDKLLFVSINTDDEDHNRILEFFGMKKDEVPAARLIKGNSLVVKKIFKPDTQVLESESEMRQFAQDFLDEKLKQHLLSQDEPEEWNKNPVKVLVASNFDEVAFDKEKDVLVEFYAPWCGHCKQLAPIYDQLAEKLADNSAVVVAKMNSTINEMEHNKINSFPAIKLYKKGDNKVVEYNGERTLEGLSKFLETECTPVQEEVDPADHV